MLFVRYYVHMNSVDVPLPNLCWEVLLHFQNVVTVTGINLLRRHHETPVREGGQVVAALPSEANLKEEKIILVMNSTYIYRLVLASPQCAARHAVC